MTSRHGHRMPIYGMRCDGRIRPAKRDEQSRGVVLLILLFSPIISLLAGCDAPRISNQLAPAGSPTPLAETTISLSVGASSVREAVKALRLSPQFVELHQRSSHTTTPLLIVYEGKQHRYHRAPMSLEVLPEIDSIAALAQSCRDAETSFALDTNGILLRDALRCLFSPDEVRADISPADNVILLRDTDLPEDDQWPLNRELGDSASRPLTCGQAEQLLRTSFGWYLGSGEPLFGSGWCDSPEQLIWDGTEQNRQVRDLLFALLRYRTLRTAASVERHISGCYQILPLDPDPQGNHRWNILVMF